MGKVISLLAAACRQRERQRRRQRRQRQRFGACGRQIEVSADGRRAVRLSPGYTHGECHCRRPVQPDEWVAVSVSCDTADCCVGVGFSWRDPAAAEPPLEEPLEQRLIRRFGECHSPCLVSLPAGSRVDLVHFKVTRQGHLQVACGGDSEALTLASGLRASGPQWPVLDLCGCGVSARLLQPTLPWQRQRRGRRRRQRPTEATEEPTVTTRTKASTAQRAAAMLVPVRAGRVGYCAPTRRAAPDAADRGFFAFSELPLQAGQELVLVVKATRAGGRVTFGGTDWRPKLDGAASPLPPSGRRLSERSFWTEGVAKLPDLRDGDEVALGLRTAASGQNVVQLRRVGGDSAAAQLPAPARPLHCFLELSSGCIAEVRLATLLGLPPPRPPAAKTPTACCVCMDAAPEVAIVNCGHLCLCAVCCQELQCRDSGSCCPVCRAPAASFLRIFPV